MPERALIDHIFVRLESQVQAYVEVRNPENTVQLLEFLAKFEERYSYFISGSKIILEFDQKSLAIQDSKVEDIKVDEGNLRVDVSETKLNVVAKVSDKSLVESII
ncbi:hypothetical protein TNCV_3985011 [Trichonephila clavipes]|nr:hypothetical protein TNCV_3985011 [Trichonephila clavipes]